MDMFIRFPDDRVGDAAPRERTYWWTSALVRCVGFREPVANGHETRCATTLLSPPVAALCATTRPP